MSRPVGCPLASSGTSQISRSNGLSRPVSAAKDCAPPRLSSRITGTQLQQIASRLTPTEQAILELVARTRLASAEQLERLFFTGNTTQSRARQARRSLNRLARWRVLDRLPRVVGGVRGGSRGFIYGVGPAGSRLLVAGEGPNARRLTIPGDRHITHTLTITELVVRLTEADRAGRLELIEAQTEPQCWRSFPGPMGVLLTVKPDLLLRIGAGAMEDKWAVEVDLSTESSSTLGAKARRHLEHYRSGSEPVHPRILWAVPDQRRADQITSVLERLPAEAKRLFSVCLLDEVVGFLATEASS
jgi:protein involved in plasmid replication-relaxation